jgi:hypothetical protein
MWYTPISNFKWENDAKLRDEPESENLWFILDHWLNTGSLPSFWHPSASHMATMSIFGMMCTAQGGGGRFNHRKPIEAICCCDAWMSERTHWRIDRRLNLRVSLFFYLSISLCLFLSMFLCLSLSLYLSLSPSRSLSLSLSIYLSVCLSACLPACLPVYLSLSIYLSIYLSLSKQYCETSSKSGTWQVQDEASLRDLLLNSKLAKSKNGASLWDFHHCCCICP